MKVKLKSILIRVSKIIVIFLFTAAMLLAVCYVFFTLFGYRAYVISSPSMGAVLSEGDIVIVRSVSFEKLETDDIITYSSPNSSITVTHRVSHVDSENRIVYTRGDENDTDDANGVPEDWIIGKYCGKITFLRFLY